MRNLHFLIAAALVLSAATANAGTLATPLAPSAGVDTHNVDLECSALNAGTKPIASVVITEYELSFCNPVSGGLQCPTAVKQTTTCTDLAPGQVCITTDTSTFLALRNWCSFEIEGSTKGVRAGMQVRDHTTGQALVSIPATGK